LAFPFKPALTFESQDGYREPFERCRSPKGSRKGAAPAAALPNVTQVRVVEVLTRLEVVVRESNGALGARCASFGEYEQLGEGVVGCRRLACAGNSQSSNPSTEMTPL
jgi:hypothetical protein